MNCGSLLNGMYETHIEQHNRWESSKKQLLEDVKGSTEAKVIKMLFKQHEIASFDYDPRGFVDEESGYTYFYRITFKDYENLSKEHEFVSYIPAPTHVKYFAKLPIPR